MNKIVNIFNFGFLKRWDRYLLLNHTLLWNFKLPYLLFYGITINMVLFSFLFFYDLELYQVRVVYYTLLTLFSMMLLILFGYWIYSQTKYVSTKEYATSKIGGFKEYLLNLLFLIMIGFPIITISTIIQSKYQYTEYDYSHKMTKEDVFKLTNITVATDAEITESLKDEAGANYRAISSWKYNYYLISWLIGFIVFSPLLLMIYRLVGLSQFLGSLSITSIILSIGLGIAIQDSLLKNQLLSIFLAFNIYLILINFIVKNRIILILSFLITDFFFLFLFFHQFDIKLFFTFSYYDLNEAYSSLLVLLGIIILIIPFIKKFLIKSSSSPVDR